MTSNRPQGALLAGVCADLAARLGWNAWALRALFVVGLLVKTIAAVVIYIVAALVLSLMRSDQETGSRLDSPELHTRGDRISDLEQRFRDLEREASRNEPRTS